MAVVTARVTVPGLHRWPQAPSRRAYLRHPHRHLFWITAAVEVGHDDRDIEFHDLQDAILVAVNRIAVPYHPETTLYDFDTRSCEAIAREVLSCLALECNVRSVVCAEDGENSATVEAP